MSAKRKPCGGRISVHGEGVCAEIRSEAERTGRSMAALAQLAWRIARGRVRAIPSETTTFPEESVSCR
jgi:uncharacterized small protein (TIGR04563 family)